MFWLGTFAFIVVFVAMCWSIAIYTPKVMKFFEPSVHDRLNKWHTVDWKLSEPMRRLQQDIQGFKDKIDRIEWDRNALVKAHENGLVEEHELKPVQDQITRITNTILKMQSELKYAEFQLDIETQKYEENKKPMDAEMIEVCRIRDEMSIVHNVIYRQTTYKDNLLNKLDGKGFGEA